MINVTNISKISHLCMINYLRQCMVDAISFLFRKSLSNHVYLARLASLLFRLPPLRLSSVSCSASNSSFYLYLFRLAVMIKERFYFKNVFQIENLSWIITTSVNNLLHTLYHHLLHLQKQQHRMLTALASVPVS